MLGISPGIRQQTNSMNSLPPYGQVESSRIITDRETGRSRGFGFIEVEESDATRMAEELNGMDYGGRPLTVNEAKPKQM